jgi:hypothetical protein
MLRLAHERTQRLLPSCKWLVKISEGDQDQALRGARQFDSAEGVPFEPYFAEHSHELLRGIHERDDTVYPRDFLLVPVDSPFDFYIPAGQRRMVETAEHEAALHRDCPDIAQLHPPGTWVFPYFVNRLTWKPQLELASAVKREEADGESSPLRNNIVLTLEYYPGSRVRIEDPCEVPAEAAGMELDDDVDVSNNTDSATTPCTSGVNTPELTNDGGTDSADEAASSNDERALAGPANLDVQANGARPERVPTTRTAGRPAALADLYLVYIVNARQDAVTRIHHRLSARTTIFHAYYVTHTPGLHRRLIETPGIRMPTQYMRLPTSCKGRFWVPKDSARLVECRDSEAQLFRTYPGFATDRGTEGSRRLGYFVVREANMVTLKRQLEDNEGEQLAHIFREDVQRLTSVVDSAESEDIDSDDERDAALDELEDGPEDSTASSTTLHDSDDVDEFLDDAGSSSTDKLVHVAGPLADHHDSDARVDRSDELPPAQTSTLVAQVQTPPRCERLADTDDTQMRVIATAIGDVRSSLTDLLSRPAQSEDALRAELFGLVTHIEQLMEHHDDYRESQRTVLRRVDEVEDNLRTRLSDIRHLLHFIEEDVSEAQRRIDERLAKLTANLARNDRTLQYIANQVTTLVNMHGASHGELNARIGQLSAQLTAIAGESFRGSFRARTNEDSTAAVQAMPKYSQIQTWTAPQWTPPSSTRSGALSPTLPPCASTNQMQRPVPAAAAARLHSSTYY